MAHAIDTNETAVVVAEMMTENTGTHMLDSGGASGRAWQRNQAAVSGADAGMTAAQFFNAQPVSKFGWPCVNPHENHRKPGDKLTAELWPSHSIFHWLTEACTFNGELDTLFNIYADNAGDDKYWMELAEEFPEWHAQLMARVQALDEHGDDDEESCEQFYNAPGGIYGDGNPVLVYTYNHENFLSQDIQFTYWEHDGEGHALIQIHNGADARGGLTKPRAFDTDVEGSAGVGILDYDRWCVSCDHCDVYWSSGDSQGYSRDGRTTVPALDDYSATDEPTDMAGRAFHAGRLAELHGDEKTIVIEQRGQYASDDTHVFCPECGIGELQPYIY